MKRAFKGLRIGAVAASLALGLQMFGSLAAGPGADAHNGAVQATTRVHVRAEPTTRSSSLTILNPGQQVTAEGTSNGWTKVDWNGRTAYVFAKYLSSSGTDSKVVSSAAPSNSYTTANLNVRTGPGLQHRVVTVASRGTQLNLTGRISGAYTQIDWRGTDRWVATRYLSVNTPSSNASRPATTGSMQTTANLHIRVGSSTSNRSVGVVPRGTVLPVTGRAQNNF
ncbi:MAG: SH3 domain-containing protein, partial [Propionibacterium sp.]|nr:SH3 domain-containing protein [Propionibacterium sp.]